MKIFAALSLLALLVSTSGCMTEYSYDKAKGRANVITGDQPTEAHPGYYALLPIAVPFDLATFPLQFLYLLSR